ncbi:MAG: hypothetical protein DI528_10835 [Shinella sp.]|nr:MAG: hypothetical protein DI528_10835 [Shinella sp.]
MTIASIGTPPLSISDDIFRKIVTEMEDGIIALDERGIIRYCNPSIEGLFLHAPESLIGQPLEVILPPRYRKNHHHHLADFASGPIDARYMGSRSSFIVGYRADGTEVNLGATILRMRTENGMIFVAVLRDLTERHGYQYELERLANTDPLSGLNNRRAFTNLAAPEIARCRDIRAPVSIVLFDVDHFKAINDQYGHDVGDTVICEFASVLKSVTQVDDLLARWGGEEFILLMPETSLVRSGAIAEMVRRSIQVLEFGQPNGLSLHLTVSAGVICSNEADETLDNMIRRSDHALYAAKEGGRNRVTLAGPREALAALA